MITQNNINKQNIKPLYTPIFNYSKREIWHSTTHNEYKVGDIVIPQTLYYILPKKFFILHQHSPNNIELYLIEDSKVIKTLNLNTLDDSFFNAKPTIINNNGDFLNIHSVDNCKRYIYETNNKFEELKRVNNTIAELLNNVLTPLYNFKLDIIHVFTQENNRSLTNDIYEILNKNKQIQKDILKIFNLKDTSNLINLLTKDNSKQSYNKIIDYINSEIDINNIKFNELQKTKKPSIEDIVADYNKKWLLENTLKKESLFGELIDCFILHYSSRYDKVDDFLGDPFERYITLKNTIKELLLQNPTLTNSYLSWINLNDTEKAILLSLCDFILESKDNDSFSDDIYKLKTTY